MCSESEIVGGPLGREPVPWWMRREQVDALIAEHTAPLVAALRSIVANTKTHQPDDFPVFVAHKALAEHERRREEEGEHDG